MKLKNKVIVITGAGTGLGKEVAVKVAQEGALVVLVQRTEKELQNVKKIIEKSNGKAAYFVCDVRDDDKVIQTIDRILSTFKHIDILKIMQEYGPMKNWKKQIQIKESLCWKQTHLGIFI